MSKFKRALSALLAVAIVFGMFSCLAPAVAPFASAESAAGATVTVKKSTDANGAEVTTAADGIISYADLVEDYGTATGADGLTDGFVYIASEYYEDDGNITDYNIQPGETLTARVYIKSNMYLGEATIMSFFDNSVWDVKKAIAGTPTYDANGYTSGSQADSNQSHPAWTSNAYKCMVTSINITNVGWIKNTCGFDAAYLAGTDLVQVQTQVDAGTSSAAYQLTSDEWLLTHTVTLKDTVEVGSTVEVTSPDVVWATYVNPSTKKHDTRKRAYTPCAHITATGINSVSNCKTMASQLDSGALDYSIRALDHTFNVTASDEVSGGGGSATVKPTYTYKVIKSTYTADTQLNPETFTSDKSDISYADLVATYGTNVGADGLTDGFIYMNSEFYEADGTLTDYYIKAGETLTARVYVKSNMYLGEATLMQFFDNSLWDVKKAIAGTPTYDANGYTSGSQAESNTNHPIWTSNAYKCMVTSINITNVGWIKNTCGFDAAYLAGTDLIQVQTQVDAGTSSAAYQPTSDEWLLTYVVTAKAGLADGTELPVTSPDVVWGSWINPSTNKHDTRKRAYIPCAHITATGINSVSNCKTMASQLDSGALDYIIRGFDHTFHIGNPPAAGSFTATFKVDGETYDTQSVATGGSINAPATAPSKDGYNFLGWAVEGAEDTILTFPQTMGNANVTYVAVFAEVAKYKATFMVDGAVYGEVKEYAEGAAIVAPADPSKTGYTFAGWNPTVGTMGSADITFTAQWTAKTYNVSYYKETTDTTAYQTLTATFDAAYSLPTAPTKLGYTFSKWVDASGADMPAKHTVAADVKFYASWTAGTFNATFKANGGTFADGSTEKVVPTVFGQAIVAPEAPTKAGGVFEGWSPEVGNMTAEGMTFTAQWSAAQIGVYFMDGETQLAALTGDSGSDIAAMSPNPSKDGYTFKGWQYADGSTADFPITLGIEPVYVYAVWEAKSYYIEFYDASGNWLDGGNQLCGNPIVAPTAPTVNGSTFIGWFDEDGNAMPETVPAVDNQVYHARYEAAKYTATFYVDSTKAEIHDTYEGTYQSVIPAPETPVKEGHTFKHWSQEGRTTKVNFTATAPKMPVNGINYVGQWTVNSYDIVYYVDNVEVNRETYTYGAAITPWTYTPAAGETFSGWTTEIPATMPANEVSIYGSTGTAVYNATFTINGEEYKVVPVEFGAAIVVPEYTVPEGHTFSGWDVPATMPAGDQTFDATLTANTYNAIFYLDDAKTQEYTRVPTVYGQEIAFPVAPEVPGKEFIAWDNSATVMGAGDMEFVAMFNNIEYFIEVYDAEGEIVDEWVAYYGDEVAADDLPEVTKEGFDFVGWFVDGVQVTFPYVITADTAFEPGFDVQSLKVIYYVDGAQYEFDAYDFGAPITLRDALVKEGYTFSGWKDADGNDAVLPETMPAEDIKVYGTFTVNQYPVTFNAGEGAFADGSKEITINVDFGTIPVAPETPALAGYGFGGWEPELAPVTVDGATYIAKFSAGMVNYTVETYTMDTTGAYGEPVVETKSAETDATVTEAPVAAEGFTLDTAASVLEGTVAADGSTVLKIYFIRNQYDLTITVDGVADTKTYYYDEEVPAVEDPAKTGYTFLGWSEEIPAKMPAKDLDITANFKINQYTITFVDTGDVAYEEITQDYATAIADVADPVKTGYTFNGWDVEIPETMPAENLTITAQWTINQYTITFVDTGDVAYEPITQDYATDIADVADPTKEGHNFLGWTPEIPATMPAEDLTVTAQWEAIIYDATFIIDGATTVVPTAFGTVPVAPTPTKVGYTFTGWEEGEVVAMVVGGATYTAIFEANTYDVIFDAAGGQFADGQATVTVPTVFDQPIVAPADPTREAYIFAGWDKEVGNLTTEGITFVAQWTNDTSFCRVQSVELVAPTTLTSITKAAYEIKVMESPVKIQIAGGEDYTFTWTYDRLDETVPGDLSEAGLVAIKQYNKADELITDETTDKTVAYEKWTIVTMLSEGAYKVRAKVGYTSADWEDINFAYDYAVEFAEVEAASDMIVSVTPAANVVKRGNNSTITVVAKSEVTRLRLVMTNAEGESLTVSYSPTATTYATVTDNGDGTSTWVLQMRFTYTGTELEQDQKWVVWYRTEGGDSWLETDKAAEVKVTKYEQTDSPSTSYDAYSIVSVTPPTDAVKATYAPVVVVTTSDVTKVRLGYNGKTSTYLQTSNNVTYADNGDGTATWTINYRFATAGEQTWTAQCRGNKWSAATEFTFTVAEA
ncbi:MAG: InlB B-repeat-containing protein [Clostridia bacterium]|nr:InlB B-repeat-containing protein [Clostridia bacterium]